MKHFLSIVVVFVLAFFIVPFTANAVEYVRVIGDYVSIWNTASSSKRLARVLYGTEMQVLENQVITIKLYMMGLILVIFLKRMS